MYIDGRFTDGAAESDVVVVNPATEAELARVPEASLADADAAVSAARRAFDEGPWGRTTPDERAAALRRLLERLVARRAELVEITVAEAGAPRRLAETLQVQVPLDHLADMVDRVLPAFPFTAPMPPTFGAGIGQGVVRREPAGVVTAITAFNYPFFLNLAKLGPALAAGCTVVLKPSPFTPLSALLLAEMADEAGLPPGVLNIVTGDVEVGRRLTTHPGVDVVTFTGSDTAGREIMRQAAGGLKRVLLELGGKSATVLFADADFDRAVPHAVAGFTRHSGQGCACLTRILVEEPRHDEAVERLATALAGLRVGDPADPATDMGPLIREAQRARVERYVALGREEGARVAFGGGRPVGLDRGYFVEPTLFVGVKPAMTIAQDEIFGPVAVVVPFADDEEAVAIANDSRYGLSGAVWSADPRRAYAAASRLRTGTVVVNGGGGGTNPHGPFGGYKDSGVGREFGEAGLSEYLETKTVAWGVATG